MRFTLVKDFKAAVKAQIKHAIEVATGVITRCERRYDKMYADPILSGMLTECVEVGADAFTGSAKYNNTSLYMRFTATLVDSLCAVKELVYDKKLVSFEELRDILLSDWEGFEELRQAALSCPHKYGNGDPMADHYANAIHQLAGIAVCIFGIAVYALYHFANPIAFLRKIRIIIVIEQGNTDFRILFL